MLQNLMGAISAPVLTGCSRNMQVRPSILKSLGAMILRRDMDVFVKRVDCADYCRTLRKTTDEMLLMRILATAGCLVGNGMRECVKATTVCIIKGLLKGSTPSFPSKHQLDYLADPTSRSTLGLL